MTKKLSPEVEKIVSKFPMIREDLPLECPDCDCELEVVPYISKHWIGLRSVLCECGSRERGSILVPRTKELEAELNQILSNLG